MKHFVIRHATAFCIVLLFNVLSTSSYAFQYKNLDLKITGTVAETYDDNITFEKEDKKEDYITTLGLGFLTRYNGKRRSLDLTGKINYRFNATYTDVKNNSENIAVNFINDFSEYDRIGIQYRFSHSHTPETYEEELERASGRRETFKHNVNFNYWKTLSERFKVGATYSYWLSQFSEEGRNDTSNNRIGLSTTYLAGVKTSFTLSYNYGRDNFDNEIHNVNFGMRYDMTERSYFNGRVGWDSSYSADQNNSNFYADVSFTNQVDENTYANIAYNQRRRFNSEEGSVSNNWQVAGIVSRQMLRRLKGYLTAFYGEDTSDLSEITNTLLGANFSLSYELWEDMNTDISYSFTDLDSTDENTGYIRNTVTLNLRKTF